MFLKALNSAELRDDRVIGAWMVPATPDYVYKKIVRERNSDYHLVMPIDLRINLFKAMLADCNKQLQKTNFESKVTDAAYRLVP